MQEEGRRYAVIRLLSHPMLLPRYPPTNDIFGLPGKAAERLVRIVDQRKVKRELEAVLWTQLQLSSMLQV